MTRYHATENGDIAFTLEEELEQNAIDAAWLAGARDRKAAKVRAQRDAKIAACDWRVLPDVLNSEVWKTYRQALRNIPQQPGFPDNVTWPVEP